MIRITPAQHYGRVYDRLVAAFIGLYLELSWSVSIRPNLCFSGYLNFSEKFEVRGKYGSVGELLAQFWLK